MKIPIANLGAYRKTELIKDRFCCVKLVGPEHTARVGGIFVLPPSPPVLGRAAADSCKEVRAEGSRSKAPREHS